MILTRESIPNQSWPAALGDACRVAFVGSVGLDVVAPPSSTIDAPLPIAGLPIWGVMVATSQNTQHCGSIQFGVNAERTRINKASKPSAWLRRRLGSTVYRSRA